MRIYYFSCLPKGEHIRTGPYGVFWVCSGETCNTKCADVDGVPSLYAKS